MTRPVVAVVGPTCAGKTKLAVELARLLAPADLINADSRQVLRGLRVGTCAPTPAELGEVRCHLLEVADPGQPFTVADWVGLARSIAAELESLGRLAIVAGGTGLYVSALVDGFDFGSVPPDIPSRAARSAAAETARGVQALADELSRRDPDAAARIDLRNPRRVLRALEIVDAHESGRSVPTAGPGPVPAVMIGLDPPRDLHEAWIRDRAARVFAHNSLLREVEAARQRGVSDEALRASGIGYREAIDVLGARMSIAAAIEQTARRTIRYAKAQRTYWRRDPRVSWRDPTDLSSEHLARELSEGLGQHAVADLRAP